MKNEAVARKVDRQIKTQVKRLRSTKVLKAKDVHDLRLLTKKLRAVLRLYPGGRHKKLKKRMEKSLRNIGYELSRIRDNFVVNKKLQLLSKELSLPKNKRLAANLSRKNEKSNIESKRVIKKLEKLATHWETLSRSYADTELSDGFRKTYAKTRSTGLRAVQTKKDGQLHRWRKWVKYWQYQSTILAFNRGAGKREYFSRLRELGSQLGDYHDLCLLESTLGEKGATSGNLKNATALSESIATKKRAMHRKFARENDYLFGKKFAKLDFAGKPTGR